MKWIRKNWLTAILGIAVLVLLAVRIYGNPKSMRFDNLSIQTLEGQDVDMAQFEGKPMVLHYWATWCGPCRAEMPGLLETSKAYGDKVSFLLVSDEKIRTLKNYVAQAGGGELPIYHKTSTIKLKGVFSIPQTYILNSKGEVVQSFEGAVDWRDGRVQRLLDEL